MHQSVIASKRAEFLKKTVERRSQLNAEEILRRKSMAPRIRRVMKGTKLLLFKSLLAEYGYGDLGVMDELVHGAAMTGMQRVPPYAERQVKAAPSMKEILESEIRWRARTILQRSAADEDKEVLSSSEDNEQGGLLSGPYSSPKAVTTQLGCSDWLANPRSVSQGEASMIDDAKSSGLNDTYSSGDRLPLQDINYVAIMCLQAGPQSLYPVVHRCGL